MERKYWKSQGNLSVRKCGNHVGDLQVYERPLAQDGKTSGLVCTQG